MPNFFHGVETQCHRAFVFAQMLLSFALDVNHRHYVLLLGVCTVKIRNQGDYHGMAAEISPVCIFSFSNFV